MKNLELVGMLLGLLVLENREVDLTNRHVTSFCHNSSTVAWSYKRHNNKSIIAGQPLRYMGLRLPN